MSDENKQAITEVAVDAVIAAQRLRKLGIIVLILSIVACLGFCIAGLAISNAFTALFPVGIGFLLSGLLVNSLASAIGWHIQLSAMRIDNETNS